MFKNFIKDLCEAESLIDVGNQGIATQSSYSKWSKPDDPQRAVSGELFDDFAFHTEKELNPWWQIEWNEPVKLQHIIINNRKRKPLDKRAINIRVLIVDDKDECICIYAGKSIFGSLPNSLPLILSLQNEYVIRKIRIILDGEDYFHLSGIHTLKKVSLQEKEGQLIFFANRTDGFGERMRAILNAMNLAKQYSGNFYFYWQDTITTDFQVIDAPKTVFDVDFMKKHILSYNKSVNLINISDVKEMSFEKLKKYDGILVQQGNSSFKDVFNDVGFSNQLLCAKQVAESITFSQKVVAIHLRMGDIVYGRWHHSNIFYYKVIPIYVVPKLIEKFKNAGFDVVIFGQDDNFGQYVSKLYDVFYVDDLIDSEFNELQRAFFEIILMSRCEKIIAETSGFSTLAALIGDVPVESYKKYLSDVDKFSLLNRAMMIDGLLDVPHVNPILRAFTISHFLNDHLQNIELKDKVKLIDECVVCEPNNSYYSLMQSALYYEFGRNKEADILLYNELMKSKQYGIYYLSTDFMWRKTVTLSQYIDSFRKAADSGSIVAAILVLLHQHYVEKAINTSYYDNLLANASSDTLGVDLLKQKLNEFTKK